MVLNRDNWKCFRCSQWASIVHHLVPVSVDISLALDPENCVATCLRCHKAIHAKVLSDGEKKWSRMVEDLLESG